MAVIKTATTPSIAIARVLRRLDLTQGKGKDFRVEGEYRTGERVATCVLLLTKHADETVAARADDIERWTAEDGGWAFTVNVRYSDKGRPHCTISNGIRERVREEPPTQSQPEPTPEPEPEPEQATAGTAFLEDAAQPEEGEQPPADEPPAEKPTPKGYITITHTRAEGTLLDGSTKGDGAYELVRPFNFRSFRSLGMLGIPRSRDNEAQRWRIDCATAALREAGWEVTVDIDESQRRSFEEAEAERLERAEGRAERFGDRADRAARNSDARHKAALGALDGIEPGQPILRGHHSERGHRRAIARSDTNMRKSIEEEKKATHWGHRAEAAEKYEERRYDPNRTRRRLEKLGAELRQQERYRDQATERGYDPGQYERRIEDLNEEIAGWERVVEQAKADGVKLWEADDFAPGDFAMYSRSWYQVHRVNPKTLSIAWNLRLMPKRVMTLEDARHAGSVHTFGMDYTKVEARCPDEAMRAFLADGKVPGTKSAREASEAQPASAVRAAQATKPKPKKRSDPKIPKRVKVECRWDATEATLTWLDGKGQPHKLHKLETITAPDGEKFTESVSTRSLLAEVTRRLTERGYTYRGDRWSGSPARGIVHAIEPAPDTNGGDVQEAAPEQLEDAAPPVDEQPAPPPPAAEPPAPVEEAPVEEPPAADEAPVDEPAPPAEDPKERRLQRQQAAALGWSAGQADLAIAAAAGWLYRFLDGTLRRQDLPGAASRIVAEHRLHPLVKAGFLVIGEPDEFERRPIRVTADGRRAVTVWKRWLPRPVEMDRQQECARLRPLLHGDQARRLAEQAREDEAKRKAASAAFWEVSGRLAAWEDREDRLWEAWAKVHGIRFRLQRRPAGWVPTEEEIAEHHLDPDVVAELRADVENPQPKPELPKLRQKPVEELPPMAADEETPEQLDLFGLAAAGN
ncbi:DUF3560 domain-containing protein [Streptomyces europaeiscabiei]|uniref:DUF3560 domain-containing protein n=1 Tax=Streptomyces europaeiscabiei TaxID=146819 RepID=UPI002E12632F|nr:DUF3560 domain-containing protein [Streptomyces europaeiscabiei]